jgi:UDP-N-acetylglucosamine diphosphorylase / glucose-1-phosphate thymidylyltransferase / UDP-N-acetylgalactosamine diphosphorylase / glucosamine-1-phosphate N-acetyltransferase / galactosamine-1-phosphate N-acetyltransferase
VVVVIPMAGRGQRFRDAGYDLPKPLIPVRGLPMYTWALRSVPLDRADRLVFVCLEADIVDHGLADDIHRRYGDHDAVVVSVPEVTGGQMCSVLAARDHLPADEALIIYNADTYVVPSVDPPWDPTRPGIDGSLGVFHTDVGDHWSFAEVDDDGRVVRTTEKDRISPWASTGLYHFARAAEFVTAADDALADQETIRGEYYIAPLYNRLIAAGARIVTDQARAVWPLGTPAELDLFVGDGPADAGGRPVDRG